MDAITDWLDGLPEELFGAGTVYVGGSHSDKRRIRAIANRLEAAGYTITHRWFNSRIKGKAVIAESDIAGIRGADAIILVLEKDLPYSGSLTELGIALALRKQILLLGNRCRENVFTWHPSVRRLA